MLQDILGKLEAARAPGKPLELYSFEISPFCRIAREALCSLEIPYLLHNVGKNSPRRPAFEERSGKMMVVSIPRRALAHSPACMDSSGT